MIILHLLFSARWRIADWVSFQFFEQESMFWGAQQFEKKVTNDVLGFFLNMPCCNFRIQQFVSSFKKSDHLGIWLIYASILIFD